MRTRRSLTLLPSAGYEAIVMGASAGGFKAYAAIVAALPPGFPLPLLLVQHLHHDDNGAFAVHLDTASKLPVIEPCDKDQIKCGNVYIAPAGYHLLVERGGTIALSTDEKVNWSRPSIDVLFESAARLWGERVIGVIMTGASSDGTAGIQAIKAAGGLTIAQRSDTAEYPFMPQAAIDSGAVDEVLTIEEIIARISSMRPTDND